MDLEKIVLSDKEIENLPLFFKTIYHNLLIDPNFEDKLMMFNPKTKFKEMRSVVPKRSLPLFYNYEKSKKDGQV